MSGGWLDWPELVLGLDDVPVVVATSGRVGKLGVSSLMLRAIVVGCKKVAAAPMVPLVCEFLRLLEKVELIRN